MKAFERKLVSASTPIDGEIKRQWKKNHSIHLLVQFEQQVKCICKVAYLEGKGE